MNKIIKPGSAFILVAAILWALDGIIRRSLFSLHPTTIVFFEHFIGSLFIAPFVFRIMYKEILTRKEWIAIIWVSFFSGLVGTVLFTAALQQVNFIPFSVVFLLQKLQPIFAIGAARLILGEKIDKGYGKWAFLAIVAAYFVTFPNGIVNLGTGNGTVIAAMMAIGAAFAWGSSTAISRYVLLNHSQTLITGFRFFLTTIMALVAVYLFGQQEQLFSLQADQVLRFMFIALSTGMVALWLYYKGLKQTQAKVATILELVFPLTAVLIDIVVYKTVLLPSQYLAAGVMLYAIYQVTQYDKGEKLSKKSTKIGKK